MSHWRLFYHIVWATQNREPLLADPDHVKILVQAIEVQCRELQIIIHAQHAMPDHVHLACSIPPRLAIADAMRLIKGTSSHQLNQCIFRPRHETFAWQPEYGVYTFSGRALPDVVAYVRDQEVRHAAHNLWPGAELVERERPVTSVLPTDELAYTDVHSD